MTTEQLTNLRRLLAEAKQSQPSLAAQLAAQDRLIDAAVNALPELLDAAEREAKLRKALEKLVPLCAMTGFDKWPDEDCRVKWMKFARAALAEGGAK